jgi:xylulokinase
MSEPLIVGIDLGTSNVKGAVFDLTGMPLATASHDVPTARPRPGWVEQDPDDWWWSCLAALRTLAKSVDMARVRSVGIVSQVNTHAFVDSALRPVVPAIVWQDQRCGEIARELDQRISPAERASAWGSHFTVDSSYLVSRCAWLAAHDRESWAATRWVLLPKDYVTARLTGSVVTDFISAIGLTQEGGRDYLSAAVGLLEGVGRRLPPLAAPAAPIGPAASDEAEFLRGAMVVTGTMDAWGNLYGSGSIAPGQAILVGGTSEVVCVVSDRRTAPGPGIVAFPPMDGLVVHAGPTQAGGDALRWWTQACGSTPERALAAAAAAPAGSNGAVFLPHLLGERAPLWDADVRGTFLGLSSAATFGELTRAVLEGVAFSARELMDAAELSAGLPAERVILSGGSANSDLWCQVKADVLQRTLHRLAFRNSGVLGAAILGGIGAGLFGTPADAVEMAIHVDRAFEPDAGNAALYDHLYQVYRDAYHALGAVHGQLSSWRALFTQGN